MKDSIPPLSAYVVKMGALNQEFIPSFSRVKLRTERFDWTEAWIDRAIEPAICRRNSVRI